MVQKANLSWVNYTSTDLETDGVKVAQQFGFSEGMIPTLLKGYYANYEDREVEVGVMVPAVRVDGLELNVYPIIILVTKQPHPDLALGRRSPASFSSPVTPTPICASCLRSCLRRTS